MGSLADTKIEISGECVNGSGKDSPVAIQETVVDSVNSSATCSSSPSNETQDKTIWSKLVCLTQPKTSPTSSISSSNTSLASWRKSSFRKYQYGTFKKLNRQFQSSFRASSMSGLSLGPILEFLKTNDVLTLSQFLANPKVHIDDDDEDGWSGLFHAVSQGNLLIVQCLLENGADPNKVDNMGRTPLFEAVLTANPDIVDALVVAGADLDARDSKDWTPLLMSSYLGYLNVAKLLCEAGANLCSQGGKQQCSALAWAAGRGHIDIVKMILEYEVDIDNGDRYGTTPLIWAVRSGHHGIVRELLEAGAKVDNVGMYAWSSLVLAASNNDEDMVKLLLQHSPNINSINQDGFTALAVACKEGNLAIVHLLINAGAHVNLQDKNGDTNLILASKGGHFNIVDLLLRRYADVDTKGKENKTALYNAVEKDHADVAKLLLAANADTEIVASDGNTALLRAVKNRKPVIVKFLIDSKAKLNFSDKNGDTALHVAMRAGSKTIIETILRNPKNSQLLYKPNAKGDTPYNIDIANTRPILSQLFGARRLNSNDDASSEKILGYELYGSALANILAEPSLALPITVGLYAKWGSGKSMLLNKLQNELKSYCRDWSEPCLKFSPFVFLVLFHVTMFVGLGFWILTHFLNIDKNFIMTPLLMAITLIISYIFLFTFNTNMMMDQFDFVCKLNHSLARIFDHLEIISKVLFCHPPGMKKKDDDKPVKLNHFFTDQAKVSTTRGGEDTVTQMICTLMNAVETHHGKLVTRLFRALRPSKNDTSSCVSYRKFCGIPYILLYVVGLVLAVTEVSLIILTVEANQRELIADSSDGRQTFETFVHVMIILVSSILFLIFLVNIPTFIKIFTSMFYSQHSYLLSSLDNSDLVKSEGQLQAIRNELRFLISLVETLDSYTGSSSRLTVIVDGLDIVEQRKVLKVLDTVGNLFSDPDSPFIILLAIDPFIIIKAIELNINDAFADTSVGGYAYLRNMVHLPFYLQTNGAKTIKMAQMLSVKARELTSVDSEAKIRSQSRLSESNENMFARIGSIPKFDRHNAIPTEMNRMFLTDDYFSDVNPRSMRRLMNVIYVMGRLLKAFKIEFNWHHLSVWINITEQWPYRTSWLIHHLEENEDSVDLETPLLTIYEKIKKFIPKRIETSFNNIDRDEKKLEIFLKLHKKTLTVRTMNIFFPFTINLDPFIRKLIRDLLKQREIMGLPIPETASSLTTAMKSPLEWVLNQRSQQNMEPNKAGRSLIPEEYQHFKLSSLAVNQICHLVTNIHGVRSHNVEKYCSTIKEQNINGKVIKNCDLKDLKHTLGMTFGDWELFKVVVEEMRLNDDKEPTIVPSPVSVHVHPPSPTINIHPNDSALEQMVLEKEAFSDLVSGMNEDARDDIGYIDEEVKAQVGQIFYSFSEETKFLPSRDSSLGKYHSRSIPKLVISTESDKVLSGLRPLSVETSSSLYRRQRSKSENPPAFDEKEEIDLFISKEKGKRFYVDYDDD